MKKKTKKLIIANWKMNPDSLREAKKIYSAIRTKAGKMQHVQTVICPAFVHLPELQKMTTGHRCVLGAQNIFYEKSGSHTGEISAKMIKDLGVSYVIIGHSERRAMGESNEVINKKVKIALKEKINVVVCVGEKERDEADYLHELRRQVLESLFEVPKSQLQNLVIAYEPVWAIGDGAKADNPSDTEETILFIKKILIEEFGKKVGEHIPLLYGGSVNPKNAKGFLEPASINGVLVGRAGISAEQLGEILKIANS